MVDDGPEQVADTPDPARARRPPPTIDLEATEVSGEGSHAGETDAAGGTDAGEKSGRSSRWSGAAASSAGLAAATGAGAAALVLVAAWLAGWPAVPSTGPATPQVDSAVIDGLAARIASVESKAGSAAISAPDPASAARMDALEKSLTAVRGEISGLRAQSDKLAADLGNLKPASGDSISPQVLSGLNDRIAAVERAAREPAAANAAVSATPADDVPLRRVVAATMLDVAVRQGDSFAAPLAAAKSLAADGEALKPLEGFAASGVPSAAALSRELLIVVPKLSPPAAESATTGSGLVDRLQAGAAKLVRIERTDTVGSDRGAVVARITAAALRNDVAEARRELKTLAPGDRAAAQAWLDKADARDAALAASHQFAADAMTALAGPAR